MANRMVTCSMTSRNLLRAGGVAHVWRRLWSLTVIVVGNCFSEVGKYSSRPKGKNNTINYTKSEVNITYKPFTPLFRKFKVGLTVMGMASGQYVVTILPCQGITRFNARHVT